MSGSDTTIGKVIQALTSQGHGITTLKLPAGLNGFTANGAPESIVPLLSVVYNGQPQSKFIPAATKPNGLESQHVIFALMDTYNHLNPDLSDPLMVAYNYQ
ncbi:hypothetical protein HYX02_05160 [Candidatus Woesearchaeota archaeon]|nr:hypothetical protein [Candidatus Woesearchaeota archaeon]